MKTPIAHQGMSYTSSCLQLDEITFIAVAECSDNVFANPVYKGEHAKPSTGWVMEQDNTTSLNSNTANVEMANNESM